MKRVEPFIFALFSKVGSGLPCKQNKVKNCSTGSIIVIMITSQWKHFFPPIPAYEANCPDSPLGIKRKMRFLHQPVFSRIDRGKNTEFSDWARKKETNLAEICHKCHPNRFDNPPFLSNFLSFGDL